MKDKDKSKEQLIRELTELREQLTSLRTRLATERHQAENTESPPLPETPTTPVAPLATPEQFYRIITELTTSYVYALRVEPDGRLTNAWLTEAFTDITGFTPEELGADQGWLSLVHPGDQEISENHRQMLLAGQPDEREFRIITRRGEVRWLRDHSQPIWDSRQEKVVGIYGLAQDITERKQTEDALRKAHQTLDMHVENSPLAVLEWDKEFRLQRWSKQAEAIFGWRAEEVLGKTTGTWRFIYPEEEQQVNRITAGLLDGSLPRSVNQNRNFTKDGTVLFCEWYESALFDNSGQLVSILSLVQDITERKQAEAQIQTSLKEKEVLLKEIHHRVKNNLQIVSSLLRLQSKQLKDEQAREMFRDSQHRIKSMALIHEKLYNSQDLSRVDFARYVKKLSTYLFQSYSVSPASIQLEIQVDNLFLDIHTAIPCGLIINELVSNSLKYAFLPEVLRTGKEPPKIWVALRVDDNQYVLTVGDTGRGLPADINIYETKSLGLQLVIRLTEQLDGQIEVDRRHGTVFTVRFAQLKA